MIIISSFSVHDLARAINEKRHLTPEEIRSAAVVVIDDVPVQDDNGGADNE